MSVIPAASRKYAQAGRVKPRQLKAESFLAMRLPFGSSTALGHRITSAPIFSSGGLEEGAPSVCSCRVACHTVRARWSLVNLANETDRDSKISILAVVP